MKALATLLWLSIILLTFEAKANTVPSVYLPNTPLPEALKEKIVESIQDHLSCLESNSLQELKTKVEVDQIDQGIRDEYFTTSFRARAYLDRYHPSTLKLSVKSVNLDISNPRFERYRVLEVTPEYFCD